MSPAANKSIKAPGNSPRRLLAEVTAPRLISIVGQKQMTKSKRTETIYVRLLDEGVDVWRPVSAEILGKERYRIISEPSDPEDEKWEFQSGDVVQCIQKELMDGTEPISHLVAVSKVQDCGQQGSGADRE